MVCRSIGSTSCLGLSPDEFVKIISISLVVQFLDFLGTCLAVITFGNSISSSILRDGVCMSTGWILIVQFRTILAQFGTVVCL
jgi:hypothetical protein